MTMLKIHKKVAQNIKTILGQQGKSAEKLAYEIGMSKCYMYDFLNGKKDIRLKTLQRIADGLEVKVENFFH
jgi:transcriptional regulator with XRE-family HTH domain